MDPFAVLSQDRPRVWYVKTTFFYQIPAKSQYNKDEEKQFMQSNVIY